MSVPNVFGVVSADGSRVLVCGQQQAFLRPWAGKPVVLRRKYDKRTGKQNRRYWALMTVAAVSLWGDPSLKDDLHEEIAHLLLSLPPCPKTGLRRRRHTPTMETDEFGRYMDDVANKVVELGADLSEWDIETERQSAA